MDETAQFDISCSFLEIYKEVQQRAPSPSRRVQMWRGVHLAHDVQRLPTYLCMEYLVRLARPVVCDEPCCLL